MNIDNDTNTQQEDKNQEKLKNNNSTGNQKIVQYDISQIKDFIANTLKLNTKQILCELKLLILGNNINLFKTRLSRLMEIQNQAVSSTSALTKNFLFNEFIDTVKIK